MAKCIYSQSEWNSDPIALNVSCLSDLDVRGGENSLDKLLSTVADLILDIGNYQVQAQQSAIGDGERLDCGQIQDVLITKLKLLFSLVESVSRAICESSLLARNKHRYFIRFSSGIINQLQGLLISIGRVTDLNQKVLSEDQRKLLVCDESISIHITATIWSASIEIMKSFREPGIKVFNDKDCDEYGFLDELEFTAAAHKHSREYLNDLLALSWLQHNRLVKYNDLVRGLPITCPCLTKTYYSMLKFSSKDFSDIDLLFELLLSISDPSIRSTMLPESVRSYGSSLCGSELQVALKDIDLSYFVIWHLYAVLKHTKDEHQMQMVRRCQDLLKTMFKSAMDHFITRNQSPVNLSPHQEERFKLMFHMLCFWCDTISGSTQILIAMLDSFSDNWVYLSGKYFDSLAFRIEGLTIFQTFTKLVNNVTPLYTIDGQALVNDKVLNDDERNLKNSWDKLLSLTTNGQASSASKQL